jgi:hypothetical protein
MDLSSLYSEIVQFRYFGLFFKFTIGFCQTAGKKKRGGPQESDPRPTFVKRSRQGRQGTMTPVA